MENPPSVYNSNQIPFGGLNVTVYSNSVAAATGVNTGTLVGVYACTDANPTPEAVIIDRTNISGGDGGWVMVNGKIQGSATIQLATNATPSLQNGWYFDAAFFVSNATPPADITKRWVISNPGPVIAANGARQQTCTIICDQFAVIS